MKQNNKFLKIVIFAARILAVLIIVALILLGGVYFHTGYQQSKVKVEVSYVSGDSCPPWQPLLVNIVNRSYRTVIETRFDFDIKRPGYSDNLVNKYGLFGQRTDKIIQPKNTSSFCFSYPEPGKFSFGGEKIPEDERPEMIYGADNIRVTFQ